MNSDSDQRELDAIAARIRDAVGASGGPAKVSERSGIPVGTLKKYMAGKIEPGVTKLRRIAETVGRSPEYLLTGEDAAVETDFVLIPLYDVKLSAGPGAWTDRAKILDSIPFTRSQLQALPGRRVARNLALFVVRGDSGGDRLPDGAIAMADTSDNSPGDGLFAFVLNDEARVKRFQLRLDGLVLSSDNKAYPDEHLDYDQLDNLSMIGRIIWCGSPL